jgi:RNA polymerase sigma factor (sigma-70 family)
MNLLFSGKSIADRSDAVLLQRFVASRDEEAFAALVARHGPIVCAVSRDVLRDSHAVEDAFQATFLILVRHAGALRIEESLGGWLYRVAYHVALRANREASRRQMRERGGADLTAFPEQSANNNQAAELHDAIARLPERYRRALVLCDLEGMPQCEAAQALHCGEATLRRRLAGARERLCSRLTNRGVPLAVLSRLTVVPQSELPAAWAVTMTRVALARHPATALAAGLAASVFRTSLFSKGAKVLLLIAGLATVAGATYTFTLVDDPRPTTPMPIAVVKDEPKVVPKAEEPPVKKTVAGPVRWVHLKSDQGYEVWVNRDAGIELKRKDKIVTMLDAAQRALFTYEGDGTIEKSQPDWLRGDKDESGRFVTSSSHDLELNPKQTVPARTPALLRILPRVLATDYEFDTLDGKKTIRLNQYDHDALGASRLQKQVWYDAVTRRRIRMKDRYQLGEQHQYGKEFETTDYTYPDTGPADMAALGVPPDTKVVDLSKNAVGEMARSTARSSPGDHWTGRGHPQVPAPSPRVNEE